MYLREPAPVEQFDPYALADMQEAVGQLHTSRYGVSSEHMLLTIYRLRPHIGAALADEEGMPGMLDVMTRMSRAQLDYRVNRKIAFEAAYAGAQMVSIHFETLQEISRRNDRIGSQALRLLFDSAIHMSPGGAELDFLTAELPRVVSEEDWDSPQSRLLTKRYCTLADVFVQYSHGPQSDAVIDAIDSFIGDESTREIGLAMQKSIAARYMKNCPEFKPKETGNGSITYSDYLKFQIRLQNCLSRTVVSGRFKAPGEEVDEDLQALVTIANSQGVTDMLWSAALQCVAEPYKISLVSEKLAAQALTHYGIIYEELREAWMIGGASRVNYSYSFDHYIRDNLRVIQHLEFVDPGSARILMEEFGIRNFSRYPLKMLVKQYRERNNAGLDYGAIVYALDDHNTALEGRNIGPKLEDLDKQLEALGCHARIYECDRRSAVLRALLQARYRYKRQLAFGLVIAHGSTYSLSLAPLGHANQNISRSGLIRATATEAGQRQRYATLFAPGASGALDSCSTGTLEGVADALATFLHMQIEAPLDKVSEGRVIARRRGQGIKLGLSYPTVPTRVSQPD